MDEGLCSELEGELGETEMECTVPSHQHPVILETPSVNLSFLLATVKLLQGIPLWCLNWQMSEPKLGETKQLVPAYIAGRPHSLGLEPRSLRFHVLSITPVAPVYFYFF